MQLRHLETFISIVDNGTLTAAAAALYKTQGAVSQDLKTLEAGVGMTLIDRSRQRIKLTSAGHALLPMARRLIAEFYEVEVEMARVRAGERPLVRIGCLPSVAPSIADCMSTFTTVHPPVRWALTTALRGTLLAGLREGRFDVVVCEARPDDDLVHVPLMREPLHVVLPERHELATAGPLSPQDLQAVPYIGLDRAMDAAGEAQRFFAAGRAYPTPMVEVTSTRLVLDLVVRLGGFGIVPDSALIDCRGIVAVETRPQLTRQISVVRLSNRTLSSSAEAFCQHLCVSWSGLAGNRPAAAEETRYEP